MNTIEDTTKADKIIYSVAFATTLLLAVCAFALSYNALHELALVSGVPYTLSFVFPIVVDGLLISGSLQILYSSLRGERSWGGVVLVLLGVIASVAGNIVVSPPTLTARVVHGVSPVVLFLSLEALTSIMRKRIREAKEKKDAKTVEKLVQEEKVYVPKVATVPLPQLAKPHSLPTVKIEDKEALAPVSTDSTPQVVGVEDAQQETHSESEPDEKKATDKKGPSLPQQFRDLLAEEPSLTIDELLERVNYKDRKYARVVARKVMANG